MLPRKLLAVVCTETSSGSPQVLETVYLPRLAQTGPHSIGLEGQQGAMQAVSADLHSCLSTFCNVVHEFCQATKGIEKLTHISHRVRQSYFLNLHYVQYLRIEIKICIVDCTYSSSCQSRC